jgi:hypothetical protein
LSLLVDFYYNCEFFCVDLDDLVDFVNLRVFNHLDDINRLSLNYGVFLFDVSDAWFNRRNVLDNLRDVVSDSDLIAMFVCLF